MGWKGHAEEIVCLWQDDFGIDTVVHPLWLDVVPTKTTFITVIKLQYGITETLFIIGHNKGTIG